MTFQHAEHLCRELIRADSTDAAVAALRQARYWDDPKAWRPLGDNPGNLSTVANQQSDPVAALAEKLTNAVDARLINACWATGANPEDPDGPNSPRAAVARFIDRKSPEAEKYGGDVWDWPNRARIGHAEKITLAVTGGADKSSACVSVADAGEGQSPSMFPDTLCSLTSSNKDRIPFAQGRCNMGGSGSLRFCGPDHLQLKPAKDRSLGYQGSGGQAGPDNFRVAGDGARFRRERCAGRRIHGLPSTLGGEEHRRERGVTPPTRCGWRAGRRGDHHLERQRSSPPDSGESTSGFGRYGQSQQQPVGRGSPGRGQPRGGWALVVPAQESGLLGLPASRPGRGTRQAD